jgi:hypothetical protein
MHPPFPCTMARTRGGMSILLYIHGTGMCLFPLLFRHGLIRIFNSQHSSILLSDTWAIAHSRDTYQRKEEFRISCSVGTRCLFFFFFFPPFASNLGALAASQVHTRNADAKYANHDSRRGLLAVLPRLGSDFPFPFTCVYSVLRTSILFPCPLFKPDGARH